MRVIKEISNPGYRISIFHWNNKYIAKFETPMLEQSYKIDQFDITSEDDLEKLFDDKFQEQLSKRFQAMGSDLCAALERLELKI